MSGEHHADDGHGHESHLPPRTSIKRWLVTTNHKDIGILYLLTSLFFVTLGGVLALLMRLQLWVPRAVGEGFLSMIGYNEAVTAHGLLMVFWFLSPFAIGFANYVVPLQIGAKDLAFPRLNALSYWTYLASGLLFMASFFQGGTLDAGWTMYAPLNLPVYTPSIGGTTVVLALAAFLISNTIGTANFLVTIHRGRAEGMGLWNMPLFTWSMLLTFWMMLFAFAALFAAVILLSYDRIIIHSFGAAEAAGFFTAEASGSLLWAHLFWFFGHPEVYIVFFPALGVMFEVFQTFAGRRLVGRKWVILAMILVALQSFLVWMHHMFLTAINLEIKTLMMATTIGISLPFDLMVFAMIYTMIKGRVQYSTPFLFVLGALVLFIIGGITGVFLGAVVLDYEFRGTYWVVAHFHYVMASGVTALIGGLYYWFPKITGKMYSEFMGKIHFATYFVGFNLLYFPMFGGWETPRRVFEYATGLTPWHQLATVGAVVFGFSFVLLFVNLGKSWLSGPEAPDNPWTYSRTAEWAIPSPPPLENWTGRVSYASGNLEFVQPSADGGDAATDGGAAVQAEEEVHADHASIWPFTIGIGLFVLFLGISGIAEGRPVYQALTVLGFLLTGLFCLAFGLETFRAPEAAVAERWPFEAVPKTKLGVWFFIASDIVVFGAIIAGFIFMRISYGWTEWHTVPPEVLPGLLNTFVLLTSSFLVVLALEAAERANKRALLGTLGGTMVLGLTFLSIKAYEWTEKFAHGDFPWSGIEESVFYLTTSLHGLHVVLGLLVAAFMFGRAYKGAYLDDPEPLENFGLYWHFVDIVWVFLFPLFYLM